MKIVIFVSLLTAACANLILKVPVSIYSGSSLADLANANDGYYNDGKITHTDDVGIPYAWIEYTLPVSTLISSVFIFMAEWCCPERYNFLLTVGDSSPPYNNPTCYDFGTALTTPSGIKSGWYQC